MSTPLNDAYSDTLISWLPATTSPTEDAKGIMSWTSSGTPTVGYDSDIGLSAIHFDGSSAVYTSANYYLAPNPATSTGAGYATVDFWIKTDPTTPQDSVAFALYNGNGSSSNWKPMFELYVSPDSMMIRDYSTSSITTELPIPVTPTTKPHHITLIINRAKTLKLYVDDLPLIDLGYSLSSNVLQNCSFTIFLGSSRVAGSSSLTGFFKGSIAGFNINTNTYTVPEARYKKGFDAYTDSPSSAQRLKVSTCRGYMFWVASSHISHLNFEDNLLDTKFVYDGYIDNYGYYGRYWGTINGYNNNGSAVTTTTDTKYAVSGKAWNSSSPSWIAIDCDIAEDPYTKTKLYDTYVPFHLDGSKPFVFDFWWSASSGSENKSFFTATVYGPDNDTTKIGKTMELWYNKNTKKIVFKMFPAPIQQTRDANYSVFFNFPDMDSLYGTKHHYSFVLVPNRYVRMYVDGVPLTADNDAPPPPFKAQTFFINASMSYRSGSAQNPTYKLVQASQTNQGYYDEIRILNGDDARAPYQIQSLRAGTSREAAIPVLETNIVLRSKRESGKVVSKRYSGVNPDASNSDLLTAFRAISGLSKNTDEKFTKVSKVVN
ncbi:MAG: hypothetical protein J5809_01715 [Selenomonadaceae bacterium]|nr:hypothetical protein [Selenomonadaceae bacterium]